ncbi:MAG: hypothetical protein IKI57_02205 [Clostridia bacterium]|nr:hypothetical protein [Clostridia bacterium]
MEEMMMMEAENASNGGNLHVFIIVLVVCAIVGITLGIIFGKKSVSK